MMSNVPARIRKKLKTAAQRRERVTGVNERDDPGSDEDDRQEAAKQSPPAPGHEQHSDLHHAGCDGDNAEQEGRQLETMVKRARDESPRS
jgi:hypothetical protein